MRQLIRFAVEFYRHLHRGLAGAPATEDPELDAAVRQALASWQGGTESAAAALDRTLEALTHIDRNVHQATLIEAWLDDLAQITARGRPVSDIA